MVAGSLLGLDQNTTLEVTHSFPFPTPKKDIVEQPEGSSGVAAEDQGAMNGHDYQIEMMKMLREVNIDNNCVGWYQSMYLGSFCTSTLIENQFSYQDNLSDNAVVILYDPVQTARGQLTLKAYRLSREFMRAHRERRNDYIKPSEILDELPIRIRNPGLINALIYDLRDRGAGGDVDFERLDLSTNPYLEKNLESLCSWIDDLANEQWKFQSYTRGVLKQRHDAARWADRRKKTNDERRAAGDEPLPDDDAAFAEKRFDAPNRMESLLISTQISAYCSQINKFAGSSFEKLFLAGSLQKEAA
jgi:translation initiation factor 3 subunit H